MLSTAAISTCFILATPDVPRELAVLLEEKHIQLLDSSLTPHDATQPVLGYKEIVVAEDAYPNCSLLNAGSMTSRLEISVSAKRKASFSAGATASTNKCDDLIAKLNLTLTERLESLAKKIANSSRFRKYCLTNDPSTEQANPIKDLP